MTAIKIQGTFTIAGYCRISVDDELDRNRLAITIYEAVLLFEHVGLLRIFF